MPATSAPLPLVLSSGPRGSVRSEHEGERQPGRRMLTAARNDTPSPLGWPLAARQRAPAFSRADNASTPWSGDATNIASPKRRYAPLLSCKTEQQAIERVGKWPMFGSWAGFKAARSTRTRPRPAVWQFDPNIGHADDAEPARQPGNVGRRTEPITPANSARICSTIPARAKAPPRTRPTCWCCWRWDHPMQIRIEHGTATTVLGRISGKCATLCKVGEQQPKIFYSICQRTRCQLGNLRRRSEAMDTRQLLYWIAEREAIRRRRAAGNRRRTPLTPFSPNGASPTCVAKTTG